MVFSRLCSFFCVCMLCVHFTAVVVPVWQKRAFRREKKKNVDKGKGHGRTLFALQTLRQKHLRRKIVNIKLTACCADVPPVGTHIGCRAQPRT